MQVSPINAGSADRDLKYAMWKSLEYADTPVIMNTVIEKICRVPKKQI